MKLKTPRRPVKRLDAAIRKAWQTLFDSLGKLSKDFMSAGRRQPPAQPRERPFR